MASSPAAGLRSPSRWTLPRLPRQVAVAVRSVSRKSGGGGMHYDLARRLAAEALGTFFLVMAVIGSGIMAETLADGNVALALLCNTLATAAILVVIITILVSVSGAQFNPAVTLVMRLRGEIEGRTALLYVAVQIAAGCLGAVAAHVMFGLAPFEVSDTARNGFGQLLGEFI